MAIVFVAEKFDYWIQKIQNSKWEKSLGIKLDSKLNFSIRIHDICQKPEQKLNAISRITQPKWILRKDVC